MNEEEKKPTAGSAEYKPPQFLDLVISVGAGALQVLVFENKDEKDFNMDLAKYSIDMLELLKEKTKGNLENQEERFLEETLHQLRMKYLEIARKPVEEAK